MPATARRVVTGHDANGKSVFLSDGTPPNILEKGTTVDFIELWATVNAPVLITSTEPEPTSSRLKVSPPPRGVRFRINVLPPGHMHHWPKRSDGRHPGMHRTRSVDFGIVLEGEIYLMLTDTETLLKPGDIVIQRGTDHAWENRSPDVTVKMAFILIDGMFSDELLARLPPEIELMP